MKAPGRADHASTNADPYDEAHCTPATTDGTQPRPSAAHPPVVLPALQPKQRNKLVVAISGGHTVTTAAVMNDTGQLLYATVGRPFAPRRAASSSCEAALRSILDKIANALDLDRDLWGMSDVASIAISAPGVARPSEQRTVEASLLETGWIDPHAEDRYKVRIAVLDDTWASLRTGLLLNAAGSVGISAYAGTGSSVFVGNVNRPQGKPYKIDGWGDMLGDDAGTFHLVLSALRQACARHDAQIAQPPWVTQELLPQCSLRCVSQLQEWIELRRCALSYGSTFTAHQDICRLAPIITQSAAAGDEDSEALVRRSAYALAKQISLAKRLAERPGMVFKNQHATECQRLTAALPVFLAGGLVENCPVYRNTVCQAVEELGLPTPTVVPCRELLGTLYVAYRSLRTSVLTRHEWTANIMANLSSTTVAGNPRAAFTRDTREQSNV